MRITDRLSVEGPDENSLHWFVMQFDGAELRQPVDEQIVEELAALLAVTQEARGEQPPYTVDSYRWYCHCGVLNQAMSLSCAGCHKVRGTVSLHRAEAPPVSWEYVGEELALFWESPYGHGKEKIATFWWPAHPVEATGDVERAFEAIASLVAARPAPPGAQDYALRIDVIREADGSCGFDITGGDATGAYGSVVDACATLIKVVEKLRGEAVSAPASAANMPRVTWEYIGDELALFWESPYGHGKEKIATFWWPAHPVDATSDVEHAFEAIASRVAAPASAPAED